MNGMQQFPRPPPGPGQPLRGGSLIGGLQCHYCNRNRLDGVVAVTMLGRFSASGFRWGPGQSLMSDAGRSVHAAATKDLNFYLSI